MRQQVQMSAARVKTVFPWRSPWGDEIVMMGNRTFLEMSLSSRFVGGVPGGTARGKASQNLST